MKNKEDKSLFLEYFGDTPQLRVLDFLIENFSFDYPMTQIASESKVSYNSIKIFFDNFVKAGILIQTRKVGKSDYFKLNTDTIFVKNLIRLDWSLIKKDVLGEPKKLQIPA